MELLNKPILAKEPDYQKKIIVFDIETAANEGKYYELYREGNIVLTTKHWFILSVAWSYLGEKKVHCLALSDFKEWKQSFCSKCKRIEDTNKVEKKLLEKIYPILNGASVRIGHNSDQFDNKRLSAKFIKYDFEPLPPFISIDTKKTHKKIAATDSNKLDDIADFYDIPRKIETRKNLQERCLRNEPGAWEELKRYNSRDVVVDKLIYLKEKGWDTNPAHNLNIVYQTNNCPKCQSDHFQRKGKELLLSGAYQAYQCMGCGHRFKGEKIEDFKPTFR